MEQTFPFDIEAGGEKTIAVALRPKVLGSFSQTLMPEAPTREEGRFHSLALTGAVVPGALTFVPSALDFGDVFRGYEKNMTVQVNNTGSVPVTIENIDMTTSDAFRVDSITPLPLTLAPGDEASINVTFDALDVASFSGTLSLNTNMYEDPILTLSGEGKTPPGLVMYDASGSKVSLDTPFWKWAMCASAKHKIGH